MKERWGDVPWGLADVVRAGVFVLVIVGLTVGLNRALLALEPGPTVRLLFAALALVAAELAIGVAVWLFAVRKYRVGWDRLGFRPLGCAAVPLAGLVVVFGLAVNVFYVLIVRSLGLDQFLPPPILPDLIRRPGGLALIGMLAVVVAPLVEEAFFRGFVFPALGRRLGLPVAAVASALLFAVAHAQPATVVPIFVLGLVLVWLFVRTGSLWACVLVHSTYNLLGLAAGLART